MIDALSENIPRLIAQASQSYHQLIIVVAPAGKGKTPTLQDVAEHSGYRYVNVSLELSERLLDLTARQRAIQTPRVLDEIIGAGDERVALLDDLELLFDVSLKLDPLRYLQGASRQRTLVVAWSGTIHNGQLSYATPGHPEYHQYSVDDLTVVMLGKDT